MTSAQSSSPAFCKAMVRALSVYSSRVCMMAKRGSRLARTGLRSGQFFESGAQRESGHREEVSEAELNEDVGVLQVFALGRAIIAADEFVEVVAKGSDEDIGTAR